MTRASAHRRIESAGPHRPWLTLLHGFSQSAELFSAQVPAFRDRFRLLLVDLPGHGRSSAVAGPFGPLEYTAAVLAAMDAAGVRTSHLWGTHTGAQVALMIALHHPERAASMVLEGAVIPGRHVPSILEHYGRARATAARDGVAAARREWFEQAPWFDVIRGEPQACRADEHRALVDAFGGAPWLDGAAPVPVDVRPEQLRGIAVPTLLVNGEHDLADFMPAAQELAQTLRSVRRVTIPRAGAFPLWEYPRAVNDAVAAFLQAQAGETPAA